MSGRPTMLPIAIRVSITRKPTAATVSFRMVSIESPRAIVHSVQTHVIYVSRTKFSIIADGTNAYRGCTSDDDTRDGKQFCALNAQQCQQCAKRGCNDNRPNMLDSVTCVKCSSSTDPNCVSMVTPIDATTCVPFEGGYTNYCFIHIENGTVARGCVLEHKHLIDDCNSWHSTTCEECRGNACNRRAISIESCIECDSRNDHNCTDHIDDYMRKQCPLTLKPAGCYRRTTNGKQVYIVLISIFISDFTFIAFFSSSNVLSRGTYIEIWQSIWRSGTHILYHCMPFGNAYRSGLSVAHCYIRRQSFVWTDLIGGVMKRLINRPLLVYCYIDHNNTTYTEYQCVLCQ